MDPPPVLRRQGYQDGQPKKTSPMRILVAAIVLTACVGWDSLAHDSWISRGNHRNAAGEWCCGPGDCFIVPKERVMMTGEGYVVIHGPLAGVGPGGASSSASKGSKDNEAPAQGLRRGPLRPRSPVHLDQPGNRNPF